MGFNSALKGLNLWIIIQFVDLWIIIHFVDFIQFVDYHTVCGLYNLWIFIQFVDYHTICGMSYSLQCQVLLL
jgi:hypothetical protein